MNNKIQYKVENNLSPYEFIELLVDSTLGERRPIDDFPRIEKMVRNSSLIITARDKGLLVGVSRCVTDFAYCNYLSDLAVRKSYQRQGIGRELIRLSKIEGGNAKLILLSAPSAVEFYPRIGMTHHKQMKLQ